MDTLPGDPLGPQLSSRVHRGASGYDKPFYSWCTHAEDRSPACGAQRGSSGPGGASGPDAVGSGTGRRHSINYQSRGDGPRWIQDGETAPTGLPRRFGRWWYATADRGRHRAATVTQGRLSIEQGWLTKRPIRMPDISAVLHCVVPNSR